MEKILDFKKNYFFWIKRYSLIQIGSYSFSLISYILYLVPSLDNDPLIYSFLITTISLVRLKLYLYDVVAFFPKDQFKINKDLLLKKLIVIVFLLLMTIVQMALLKFVKNYTRSFVFIRMQYFLSISNQKT